MRKVLKYITISIIGIVILTITISDKNLKLGIVNVLEEPNTIEILIDGELYRTLNLEQSILPLEFIEVDMDLGFHKVDVLSKDCNMKESFEFINLIGYNINVEYQPAFETGCITLIRTSYFGLIYQ